MSSSPFDLTDRVIVVTGGLGQLGRQFTDALADHGARVAVIDLPDRIAEDGPPDDRVFPVAADVTDRAALERAVEAIEARWGPPFGLINNAALDAPPTDRPGDTGPLEHFPLDSWQRIFDVNVTGAVAAAQVFGERMARAGRGTVLNVGSIYGLVSPDQRIYESALRTTPFFKPAAYGASKAALFNFTRYAATYWAPRGVRVNAVALGGVFNHQPAAFVDAYNARVPLGRMARADEYNGAIVFLMSDAASYMTGATLVLDGGWTAW